MKRPPGLHSYFTFVAFSLFQQAFYEFQTLIIPEVEIAREIAERFLTDLLKLPSHHCRADTTKRYLERTYNTFTEVYNTFVQKQNGEGINRKDICCKTLFSEIL